MRRPKKTSPLAPPSQDLEDKTVRSGFTRRLASGKTVEVKPTKAKPHTLAEHISTSLLH